MATRCVLSGLPDRCFCAIYSPVEAKKINPVQRPGFVFAVMGLRQRIHPLPHLLRHLSRFGENCIAINSELPILIDHDAIYHHAMNVAGPQTEGDVPGEIRRQQRRRRNIIADG